MQDELDFTGRAYDVLYETVDHAHFRDKDASLIYDALSRKLVQRSFGDYLKRYIFVKAGMTGDWREIPLNDYRRIIVDAFADNNTPPAFEPTTAKLSALTKNWLTQSTVRRQVVFLLGFGLRMSLEDVSAFLIKALRERDINPKDPFELLCWYCFRQRYGYADFSRLREAYNRIPPQQADLSMLYGDRTVNVRNSYSSIHDDATLLAKLSQMKNNDNVSLFSVTARQQFDLLYDRTRLLIAEQYNRDGEEEAEIRIGNYYRENEYNARLSDADKLHHAERIRSGIRRYSPQEITAGDVEKGLCSAIPTDRNGNLERGSRSALNAMFLGRRFSRQHIAEILQGKADVDRFDLITLLFFIFSQKADELPDRKTRFWAFVDEANKVLTLCSMGELLTSNAYECFVMMCMLSEDPLGTYADVFEMSYETENR